MNGRRHRSPSFSCGTTSDFRRSESDVRSYIPSNYEPGPAPPRADGGVEPVFDETDTKRYFDQQARERARRKVEDDGRGQYGESPRRGYDDVRPRRNDYANDEEYWRAGGRRDRGYDDFYTGRDGYADRDGLGRPAYR